MPRPLALTGPGMFVAIDMVPPCWMGRPARSPASRCCGCSGDDLGAACDGGLAGEVDGGPVEHLAAAVDGVGGAVAGVDPVLAVAAGEQLLAAAAGDLIVAVVARQLHGVRAAGKNVGELRAQDGLDVVPDAVVVAGTTVAGLQVQGHLDAGDGEEVVGDVEADAAVEVDTRWVVLGVGHVAVGAVAALDRDRARCGDPRVVGPVAEIELDAAVSRPPTFHGPGAGTQC